MNRNRMTCGIHFSLLIGRVNFIEYRPKPDLRRGDNMRMTLLKIHQRTSGQPRIHATCVKHKGFVEMQTPQFTSITKPNHPVPTRSRVRSVETQVSRRLPRIGRHFVLLECLIVLVLSVYLSNIRGIPDGEERKIDSENNRHPSKVGAIEIAARCVLRENSSENDVKETNTRNGDHENRQHPAPKRNRGLVNFLRHSL